VELFARSRPSLTGTAATSSSAGSLAKVAALVQPHLEKVEARIVQQAAAFDPAIEGYVVYALGSRGKRLRPLLTLLAGGATGEINSGHIDLAVIVELIHIATLMHDDVMDEAERRRAQPTANAFCWVIASSHTRSRYRQILKIPALDVRLRARLQRSAPAK